MDNIRNIRKKIILFGAGRDGYNASHLYPLNRVEYIVDNDKYKEGMALNGIPIISFDTLRSIPSLNEYEIVVASNRYGEEMARQLSDANINNYSFFPQSYLEELFCNSDRIRVILANTHVNTNLGDHLISCAEISFLNDMLGADRIIEIPASIISHYYDILKQFIYDSDIILISGGGYLGSLWLPDGEDNVRKLVEGCPNNRIIVLPQSIYFEDNDKGKQQERISKDIYLKHKNIHLCLRDLNSVEIAHKVFGNCVPIDYLPDMALYLRYDVSENKRGKVGVCFRKDEEGILENRDREYIIDSIVESGDQIIEFDMHILNLCQLSGRQEEVNSLLSEVSHYKYVVTDRLHCMIAAVITGTPCLAFDNLTGKVKGVYEWVKENIYVRMAYDKRDIDDWIQSNIFIEKYSYSQHRVLEAYRRITELMG